MRLPRVSSGGVGSAYSARVDLFPVSPAGLTRGSIFFAKGWIAGSSPAMTANGASTSSEHALVATQVILHGVGGYVYECDCETKTYHDAEYENQSGFHLRLSESEDPAPRSLVKFNTIVPRSEEHTS